jgi:hypothetical protein
MRKLKFDVIKHAAKFQWNQENNGAYWEKNYVTCFVKLGLKKFDTLGASNIEIIIWL